MANVSRNPFRTPAVSPNPTGTNNQSLTQTQQYAAPSNPPPSTQQFAPPSNPPPTQQQYAPPSTSHADPDPTGLTEEEPPAYTTRADVRLGETTLEYGPARPFQPAPPPPQIQRPTPPAQQPSLWQQLTGQITGASTSTAQFPPAHWSAYPGGRQQQQQQYAPPPQPQQRQFPPPPQHPQQQQQAPAPPTTHLSEFARDFYATTTEPPNAFSDVSGARNTSSTDAGYPPPASRSPTTQYAPPPGPPPSNPITITPSPTGPGAGIPDDGRPTRTPAPGHPLLLNGNMLVYPPYHECSKCNNTGYKHGDPMRPCHKCWIRYARPYTGAFAYAPNSSGSGSNFQRPLPRLYAAARSRSPLLGSSSIYPPPAPGNSPSYLSSNGVPPRPSSYPGPVTYAPGDARMGGTPCWRCNGRGNQSWLVFEFEGIPCSVCRGVGRVFV